MREEVEGVRYAYKKKEDINWPEGVAKDLSMLASLCLQDKPERRPKMEHVSITCCYDAQSNRLYLCSTTIASSHSPTHGLLCSY